MTELTKPSDYDLKISNFFHLIWGIFFIYWGYLSNHKMYPRSSKIYLVDAQII